MVNPLANADQFAAERDAAAMRQTATVRRARATIAPLFRMAYGSDAPEDAHPGFDRAMDEYIENYLLKAAACDPTRPRLVRAFMPEYHWDGRDVPGTRIAADNPDTCYRMAGIAHGGRYRLTVRPTGLMPVHASFSINANFGQSVIVQNLEIEELQCEPDGSFVLTIDDSPAGGRANHLTTTPHIKFLFTRERFEDWSLECGYDMVIERLDPVAPLIRSIEELAEIAAFRAQEDVPLNFWFHRLTSGLPMGTLRKPHSAGGLGGVATMASSTGWYRLEPDEAVLVRYHPAGAAYASIQLIDWWFRSIDADRIQSTLSRAQSIVDADGWISLVIARRDPGVANWVDTGGLGTILFICRWQGLPKDRIAGSPAIDAQVVNIAALPDALRRAQAIDPQQRAAQLAARHAGWARRVTAG